MSWNYRVLRREVGIVEQEPELGIYEVYYSDEGLPNACSAQPQSPRGDSLKSLHEDFLRMAKAFSKPVLDFLPVDDTMVMRPSVHADVPTPASIYTLEDVLHVASAVRKACASKAFPCDTAYRRSVELGGGRPRLDIEGLDIFSIVFSCLNQPQQQSESDTK